MFTAATKEDIKSDVKNGAARVSNDVRQTAKNVRDDLNKANLEGTVQALGQRVHDYIDSATNEINDASNRLTSQIRTNPVQSSVVALAIGVLVGMVFRR